MSVNSPVADPWHIFANKIENPVRSRAVPTSIVIASETRVKNYMIFRLPLTLLFALSLVAGCASPGPDSAPIDKIQDSLTEADPSVANAPDEADIYRLGEGDVISIQVFDEPDLTLETAVGASGAINYSYLGDVRVAGKSPAELEKHIAGLLQNGYLVNPSVNVRVTQHRLFFVNGEVRSPGGYSYQPGLTLDRAIALAGGLTDRASSRKIFVTKENSSSSDQKRIKLNYKIRPGDTITILEGFF